VQQSLAVGALGYVLKHTAADDLVPAVHAALRGERLVSPGVSDGRLQSTAEDQAP
jgi:DNA-binding NarL/FixJ family response regulator